MSKANTTKKPFLKNSNIYQQLISFAALALLFIFFSIVSPNFFTVNNFFTVALQTSIIAFIGIGVTFVIITGGIDLGIGSVLALSGVVCGITMRAGMSPVIAVIFGLLAGTFCGLCNAFLVTHGGLPPFIATLGMMGIARGFTLYVTGASPVIGIHESFEIVGGNLFWKIPTPVVLMFVLALLAGFILKKTKLGRYTYATGSNEEASRLSGLNITLVKFFVYAFSGALAAVAGIVLTSRLVTAQPTAGVSYELDAIASSVIGGTSLMGGAGTITGTMIGAFIIGILRNGLNMLGVSYFVQQMIIGFVIIGAVYIDQIKNRKK